MIMKQANERVGLLSLALLLVVIGQPFGGGSIEATTKEPRNQVEAAASKTWFESISFAKFKISFHKTYPSLIEELWRHKIFTASLIRAFVSQASYWLHKSPIYLKINQMSDWTKEEWRSTLMDESEYNKRQEMREKCHQTGHNSTSICRPMSGQRVAGDNSISEHGKKGQSDVKERSLLKGLKDYVNKVKVVAENAQSIIITRASVPMPKRSRSSSDTILIDHRKHNCLNRVKSQGDCGSCAYFSLISLYEWAYCRMTGDRINFSIQYAIDCSANIGLGGCEGAFEDQIADFVSEYGFELEQKYAYTSKDGDCPYPWLKGVQAKMGQYHLDKARLVTIPFVNIQSQLNFSPVLTMIRTADNFPDYGGGLDDGAGCEKDSGLHMVLIVGSGREDGHEYWIIRNSYGIAWGESGHYRLKKNNNCYNTYAYGYTLGVFASRKYRGSIELANHELPLAGMSETVSNMYRFSENPKHDDSYLFGRGVQNV